MPHNPNSSHKVSRTVRIPEIAALAGVSVATVDRVLNERGSVSDKLRRQVVAAARQLNIRRTIPSANHGVLHFDVVLPSSGLAYFQQLERSVQANAQLIGPRVSIHRTLWRDGDERALIRFLQHPPYRRAGLMLMARDVPKMRHCLRALQAQGTPVVTITSDITGIHPHRYVGVDNRMAGRTAAYTLGRFLNQPGRVLMLIGSLEYRDHVERVAGFREVIEKRFPGLMLTLPMPHYDRTEDAYEHVRKALRQYPDLVAIYNTGSEGTGIRRAVEKLAESKRLVWVAHEITVEHANLMTGGYVDAVIDQDPDRQVFEGLRHLLWSCGEIEDEPISSPTQIRVITPENILWSDLRL